MIPSEIINKVRLVEIKTRKLVNNLFGGEYHSAFKGSGMEFAEVREYVPGDDIRSIDWNVTARTGKPYVKKYDEERELSVIIIVDVSASSFFGTGNSLKTDVMVELSSIISFSAIKNNDKVGLLLFSDKIEKYIPPSKGKKHVLRVIRELIYHQSSYNRTNINIPLEHIQKVIKRKSILFLLSDFWSPDFSKSIKLINKKHDLINMQILDSTEKKIMNLGLIKFHDIETQKSIWLNTGKNKNRIQINKNIIKINKNIKKIFTKNKIDFISIDSNKDYIKPLEIFFHNRSLVKK